MLTKDKVLNNLNIYERNIYKYIKYNSCLLDNDNILNTILCYLYVKLNKVILHKIFLDYIELPITTKCSLRCKECSNLIQYYSNGVFYDADSIINDVTKLTNSIETIKTLRILGGEPLLHPELKKIVVGISKNRKIREIQIVTNGTMLFKQEVISVLRKCGVSVYISNYGVNSKKYEELIGQLKKNNIKFVTQKQLYWTQQSDCSYRCRDEIELRGILKRCKLDCISLLDGKVHLCPRSSHGADLKLFVPKKNDYVDLRKMEKTDEVQKYLFELLNVKSIRACNYCDMFDIEGGQVCTAGEQACKEEMQKKYIGFLKANRKPR